MGGNESIFMRRGSLGIVLAASIAAIFLAA